MSTSIVLSNNKLLINIDYELKIKDLYFPNVGSENQLNRYINDFFVSYKNEKIPINSDNFDIKIDYKNDYLIGIGSIFSKKYKFQIETEDYILSDRNIFLREILIKEPNKIKENLKIFFTQNFSLNESIFADTVYYDPLLNCLIQYKKDRYLAFGILDVNYDFSCSAKSDNNGKGAVPNKENILDRNLISTGNVNSIISIDVNNNIKNFFKARYFIIAGKSKKEIEKELQFLRSKSFSKVKKDLKQNKDIKLKNLLDEKLGQYFDIVEAEKIKKLYFRSISILKTQIDSNGAIIASNDGQYLKTDGTDSYSYVWPRDAGEIIKTLIDIDEKKIAKNSLKFLLNLIDKKGFFWHKYYPQSTAFSASIASSWQPWLSKNNNMILPIQEDGTAIFLQAFAKYILKYKDQEFLFTNWNSKIKPVIEFLLDFNFFNKNKEGYFNKFSKDFIGFNASNLIMPSFDIWEQYYGIFTYTLCQVLSALNSALELSTIYEDLELIDRIKETKSALYEALLLNLTDGKTGRFLKGIHLIDKAVVKNTEIDSSLISIWKNEIIDILDPKVTETMNEIISKLTVKGDIGGISRKENDNYLKISDKNNPWVLSTLWVCQYYFKINDIEKGKDLLLWVVKHTDFTGLMSEQINPINGFSLSVKPLTWSHAEFINTINLICTLN